MNMMDDCETSLQVLRGFDADITAEVNDIKACIFFRSSRLTKHNLCEQSLNIIIFLTLGTWLYVLHSSTNF